MTGQLPFLQPAFTSAPSFGANQASSSIFRIEETLIDSSHQGDLGRNSNPTKIRRFSLAPDPHWWEPNVTCPHNYPHRRSCRNAPRADRRPPVQPQSDGKSTPTSSPSHSIASHEDRRSRVIVDWSRIHLRQTQLAHNAAMRVRHIETRAARRNFCNMRIWIL